MHSAALDFLHIAYKVYSPYSDDMISDTTSDIFAHSFQLRWPYHIYSQTEKIISVSSLHLNSQPSNEQYTYNTDNVGMHPHLVVQLGTNSLCDYVRCYSGSCAM